MINHCNQRGKLVHSVKQSGAVTPRHVAIWTTEGVVQDGGYVPGSRAQTSVTTTPIVVAATDEILNCNIPQTAACALPVAATRIGLAITFVDLGQALAHPITVTANVAAGDVIYNPQTGGPSATYVISQNLQSVTFVPFDDGVNTGWTVR